MKIFSPILKGTTTMSQGTTNLSGSFTGSLLGTAATASYADNFTVGGTLTAQTINVQIITSSIEFNTGSTRNGALSTNTHQFTGSVLMSGSLGIGTSSPVGKLDIAWGGYQTQGGAINIGADIGNLTTRTNNTTKYGIISAVPYTTSDKSIELLTYYSNSTEKALSVGGGGNTDFAGLTSISFLTTSSLTQPGAVRMTVTSAGNVLIGRTTLTGGTGTFEVEQNSIGGFTLVLNSSNAIEPSIYLRNVGSATKGVINSNLDLAFHTNATERMRITSAGTVQITNAGSLSNSFQIYPTGNANTSGTTAVIQLNQSFAIQMDTISGTAYASLGGDSAMGGINFRTYSGGYAYRFFFYSNGTAYNSTGTWGSSSDIRLKQDIVDANSQWGDIKSLKFKKYRLKKDVQNELESTDGFIAPTHFGLIAQDVELTSPGLVEEVDSEDGGKTKMLKTSVMLMKSVKALQEAMAKIETLEADNNTLKEILQRNNIQ
jgi:hypothetical protein